MTRRLRALVAGVALVAPLLTVTGATAAAAEDTSYKIPSMLRQQAQQVSQLGTGRARQLSANALRADQHGIGVQVYADGPVTTEQESQLRSLGVTVQTNAAKLASVPGVDDLPVAGLVSTLVPADKLDAVAALPWVATLRPSIRPATDVGPNTAEGVKLHKADIAQQHGLSGKGQTVGVMSGDADHVAEA